MNKMSNQTAVTDTDRRRSFRVEDRVFLSVRPLSQEEYSGVESAFDLKRHEIGLSNEFVQEREAHRPVLKMIERAHPDICSYLEYLETKIDHLASQLDTLSDSAALRAKGRESSVVNLSANGMRIETRQFYQPSTALEIIFQLIPSRLRILAYGRVVWCARIEASLEAKGYRLGVDFERIHPQDREILTKHILARQLETLQSSSGQDQADD